MPWFSVRRCSIGIRDVLGDLHDCGLCKDWTRKEFSMSCFGELMVLPKYFPTLNFSRPGVSLASELGYFWH